MWYRQRHEYRTDARWPFAFRAALAMAVLCDADFLALELREFLDVVVRNASPTHSTFLWVAFCRDLLARAAHQNHVILLFVNMIMAIARAAK
ncbi:hypothetical protein [Methylobacterium indicum]|uniref:hypothetical protein n=1 Tax=Methylobacterium indicum TaxID=1775910 RepID=UPI001041D3D5|nr:hypothetical protein [Methylobacterium indicum]